MSVWWFIPFIIVAIIVSLSVNAYKKDLCEHNGLGQWHYFTQVCEPLSYPHNG